MVPIGISALTICGIDELASHGPRDVTHVLSLLDPGWPDVDSFKSYGAHERTTMRFHDIIDPEDGKILPNKTHVNEVLHFGAKLAAQRAQRERGHLLVHCHMGISRSTAAMLSLLAQVHPDETEDRLFERLRQVRLQAWPNSVMIGYADQILGRGGRLNDALYRHYAFQIRRDPRYIGWMNQLGRQRELEMAG